jgi:hypothetical protein
MALRLVGAYSYLNYCKPYNLFDMRVEGTRVAFETLISERGIYKRLGVERSTVATWKIYLREGKSISLDKMEEMLIKAGATVAQEKVWVIDEPK